MSNHGAAADITTTHTTTTMVNRSSKHPSRGLNMAAGWLSMPPLPHVTVDRYGRHIVAPFVDLRLPR